MGQEWAATSPFQYFTDHNEQLGRLVTEGRRREFGRFTAFADPATRDTIPDPQAESTFTASRLDWNERAREPHASTLALYRRLLALRRSSPAMADARGFAIEPAGSDGLVVRRGEGEGTLLFFVRLRGAGALEVGDDIVRPPAGCAWQVVLATADCSPGASAPGQVTGADVGGRGSSLAGPSGLKAGPPFVLKAGPPFVRPGAIVFDAVAEEAV